SGAGRPWVPLLLSARTPQALTNSASRLAAYLRTHPEASLSDVGYTLEIGRRGFDCRRMVLAQDLGTAIEALEKAGPRSWNGTVGAQERRLVFMFPGQGSQYPGMGRELYDREPVFRAVIDECAQRTRVAAGFDFRDLMFAEGETAAEQLRQTLAAQLS